MPVSYDPRETPPVKKTIRRKPTTQYKKPIGPPAPGRRAPGPFPQSPSTSVPKPPGPVTKRKKIRKHKKSKQYKRAIKAAKRAPKRLERNEQRAKRELLRKILKAHGRAKVDTDTKILGVNIEEAGEDVLGQVKRELEGRGVLAAGTRVAKNALDDAKIVSSAPVNPIASSDTSPKAARVGSNRVFANFLHDVIDLPAQVPASTYQTAAAAFEAAKGDTSRAKKLWTELKNHDAIALAAQGRWDEAKKAAEDHPGILALELWGAKGLVGRLSTAARVTKPKPHVRKLEDTQIEVRERREKDAITHARKSAQRQRARKKAQEKRARAREHEALGNQALAKQLRDEARAKDPDVVQPPEVRRRVDERLQANEDVRRVHRAKITRSAAKTKDTAAPLVAQGIVKPDRGDLLAYRRELEAQHKDLTPAGKLANQDLRKQIQEALDDPKLDLAGVQRKAEQYRDLLAPLERQLAKQGVLPKAQAERAKLIPYAVRNMGAKHDGDRLTLNGRKLSNREIRAHMKQNGVKAPAFVTQAPNMRGGRNFYQGSGERPRGMTSQPRTGEATRKGTFDAHPDTMVEGAARLQGLVDTNDGFRGVIKEFGRRENKKVKTYRTRKEAQAKVNDLEARGGSIGYRAVRINPWAGKQDQLRSLLDEVDADSQVSAKSMLKALEDAVEGGDGAGPWALIPEAAADQLLKHLRVAGASSAGKTAQLVNSAFRKTVLSTSLRWATGNVVEAGLRSAVVGAGPRSFLTGRRSLKRLKEIDPKAFEETSVRAVGGGHFSMAQRAHVYRNAEQFYGTRVEPAARVLGAVWRTPGPKQVARGWRVYTDFVFGSMRKLESQFQTAMFGKALRDDLVRLSDRAIADAARGLKNTNAQVAYGRAVDRAYGRYSKWSPVERQAIALYTPFVAWTLNAAYFLTRTLPADHPVLLGVLAAQHVATEEWRKDRGLSKFLDGGVPNWLQGSIPTSDGWLRVGRYTPFAFAQDPLDTVASAVLPQYQGPLMAFQGLDWKGARLYKDGREYNDIEKFVYGVGEFLKATVPVSRQVESVAKGDGPLTTRLRKEFNPFEVVTNKKDGSSGGGNVFDSGGSSDGGNMFDGGDESEKNLFD